MGFVYCIASGCFYKIGVANDVQSRLATLQTGNPVTLNLISQYEFDNPFPVEQSLHQRFRSINESLEWFRMNQSDLDTFEQICSILGGKKVVGKLNATDEEIEDADDAGEKLQVVDYDQMIQDGWRWELSGSGARKGKYYIWVNCQTGQTRWGGYFAGANLPERTGRGNRTNHPTTPDVLVGETIDTATKGI